MNTDSLATTINAAWERRQDLSTGDTTLTPIVAEVLDALNNGELRVAEPGDSGWHVNEWVKKAVLLSFRLSENRVSSAGEHRYFDKVPLKYAEYDAAQFAADGARIVPGAVVRHGSYVAGDAVVMPSYINIGAYVGAGTMVDTWATVGSCAQIGANVHLSGGVGIGGVLEPIQAAPTIIEDDCFVGARSEIVEGVVVEKGAVISMGVYIGQSTRIYDRESGSILYGRVPSGSVVVPGSLPSSDGSHALYAAIIVKRVDEKTRAKTDLNELLRPTD
ncbi:MAG: 2,3,4,5-tetrahydropyridine-2,6-dicarboxylate N-succinyltransferase [Pseudomonadota bacterium]